MARNTTIVAIVYLLLFAGHILSCGNDLSCFILAGENFSDLNTQSNKIAVIPGDGYDGQFYYRLALDPFTRQKSNYSIILDAPRYRQQRILYPLLAWAFSFGNSNAVPVALVAVNYLALLIMTWTATRYFQLHNRNGLWGLAIPLYIGFSFSFLRNLAEIVEVAWLLLALLSLHQQRYYLYALLMSLAILTKETALLAALAVLLIFLIQRKGWLFAALPIAVFALWQGWLWWNWGYLSDGTITNNLGFPFIGLAGYLRSFSYPLAFPQLRSIFNLAGMSLLTFLVAWKLPKSNAPTYLKIAWASYLVLAITLTGNVWVEDWAFQRALSEFYVLGMLVLADFDHPGCGPVLPQNKR